MSTSNSPSRLFWLTSLVTPCLIVALTGCGEPTATIEGTITFDGQPVSRGSINFEPVNGDGVPMGCNVEEGRYRVEDVQYGEKIVRIHAVKVISTERTYEHMGEDSPVTEITEDLIPLKYNFQSELKLDVNQRLINENYKLVP